MKARNSILIIVFFFFIIFFIISSCKKDPPVTASSLKPYYLKQATKDYCYFKPGTWWLYQDSITGVKDSVYVVGSVLSYDTITEQDNLGYTGIFEFFYVLTHSSYLNFTQKVYLHSSFSQYSNMDHVEYYRYNSNYVGGTESYFVSNFQPGNTYGGIPGLLECLGYQDSLLIGNFQFYNCVSFHNDENTSEYNKKTINYFSRNIGLVKKELPDSSRNWILANYNIVQ